MDKRSITRLALLGVVLAACDASEEPAEICDGSTSVRLSAKRLLGGGGGSTPAEAFRGELGADYLYVRGTCEYWAYRELDGAADRARTGVLSAADAEAISVELSYGSWSELAGRYGGGEGSMVVLYDGQNAIACPGCNDDGTDPRLGAAVGSLRGVIEQLTETGTPYDGPMRVIAGPVVDPLEVDGDWPLSLDPESLASPFHYELGTSDLVDDPAEVAALRLVFDGATPDDLDLGATLQIPDSAEAKTYHVVTRDSLPIEDDRGLVQIPFPCRTSGECGTGSTCAAGVCEPS